MAPPLSKNENCDENLRDFHSQNLTKEPNPKKYRREKMGPLLRTHTQQSPSRGQTKNHSEGPESEFHEKRPKIPDSCSRNTNLGKYKRRPPEDRPKRPHSENSLLEMEKRIETPKLKNKNLNNYKMVEFNQNFHETFRESGPVDTGRENRVLEKASYPSGNLNFGKYKRQPLEDRPKRPHSENSLLEMEKRIETPELKNENLNNYKLVEFNQWFDEADRESGPADTGRENRILEKEIYSSGNPTPGKYKRRPPEDRPKRPYSENSLLEMEKRIESPKFKNKNLNNYKMVELNQMFDETVRESGPADTGRENRILEKTSLRTRNKSKETSVTLDPWVQTKMLSQPLEAKYPRRYKRPERRFQERPFSQPSEKENERYVKSLPEWNDSLFFDPESGKQKLSNKDENSSLLEKCQKSGRNKRDKRPSSQILISRIEECIKILESRRKLLDVKYSNHPRSIEKIATNDSVLLEKCQKSGKRKFRDGSDSNYPRSIEEIATNNSVLLLESKRKFLEGSDSNHPRSIEEIDMNDPVLLLESRRKFQEESDSNHRRSNEEIATNDSVLLLESRRKFLEVSDSNHRRSNEEIATNDSVLLLESRRKFLEVSDSNHRRSIEEIATNDSVLLEKCQKPGKKKFREGSDSNHRRGIKGIDTNGSKNEAGYLKDPNFLPISNNRNTFKNLLAKSRRNRGSLNLEDPETKTKPIVKKYSRQRDNNKRSVSAPTVFTQTNVPNYFEYTQIETSKPRKKKPYSKDSEGLEEGPIVDQRHDARTSRIRTRVDILANKDISRVLNEHDLYKGYDRDSEGLEEGPIVDQRHDARTSRIRTRADILANREISRVLDELDLDKGHGKDSEGLDEGQTVDRRHDDCTSRIRTRADILAYREMSKVVDKENLHKGQTRPEKGDNPRDHQYKKMIDFLSLQSIFNKRALKKGIGHPEDYCNPTKNHGPGARDYSSQFTQLQSIQRIFTSHSSEDIYMDTKSGYKSNQKNAGHSKETDSVNPSVELKDSIKNKDNCKASKEGFYMDTTSGYTSTQKNTGHSKETDSVYQSVKTKDRIKNKDNCKASQEGFYMETTSGYKNTLTYVGHSREPEATKQSVKSKDSIKNKEASKEGCYMDTTSKYKSNQKDVDNSRETEAMNPSVKSKDSIKNKEASKEGCYMDTTSKYKSNQKDVDNSRETEAMNPSVKSKDSIKNKEASKEGCYMDTTSKYKSNQKDVDNPSVKLKDYLKPTKTYNKDKVKNSREGFYMDTTSGYKSTLVGHPTEEETIKSRVKLKDSLRNTLTYIKENVKTSKGGFYMDTVSGSTGTLTHVDSPKEPEVIDPSIESKESLIKTDNSRANEEGLYIDTISGYKYTQKKMGHSKDNIETQGFYIDTISGDKSTQKKMGHSKDNIETQGFYIDTISGDKSTQKKMGHSKDNIENQGFYIDTISGDKSTQKKMGHSKDNIENQGFYIDTISEYKSAQKKVGHSREPEVVKSSVKSKDSLTKTDNDKANEEGLYIDTISGYKSTQKKVGHSREQEAINKSDNSKTKTYSGKVYKEKFYMDPISRYKSKQTNVDNPKEPEALNPSHKSKDNLTITDNGKATKEGPYIDTISGDKNTQKNVGHSKDNIETQGFYTDTISGYKSTQKKVGHSKESEVVELSFKSKDSLTKTDNGQANEEGLYIDTISGYKYTQKNMGHSKDTIETQGFYIDTISGYKNTQKKVGHSKDTIETQGFYIDTISGYKNTQKKVGHSKDTIETQGFYIDTISGDKSNQPGLDNSRETEAIDPTIRSNKYSEKAGFALPENIQTNVPFYYLRSQLEITKGRTEELEFKNAVKPLDQHKNDIYNHSLTEPLSESPKPLKYDIPSKTYNSNLDRSKRLFLEGNSFARDQKDNLPLLKNDTTYDSHNQHENNPSFSNPNLVINKRLYFEGNGLPCNPNDNLPLSKNDISYDSHNQFDNNPRFSNPNLVRNKRLYFEGNSLPCNPNDNLPLSKNDISYDSHNRHDNSTSFSNQEVLRDSGCQTRLKDTIKTQVNHPIDQFPEYLNLSTDRKATALRKENGKNRSSENEIEPLELDWSISEISVVENDEETENITRSHNAEKFLVSQRENDSYVEPKVSSSDCFAKFNEGFKKSFASSPKSKNSVKIKRNLEFLSASGIRSPHCAFVVQRILYSWKKEYQKHLAAKSLWKRHSLRKGMNALRQAVQDSQLLSAVLQDKVSKISMKSAFLKWKQEASLRTRDQLAASFQKWKENAKEQKRFRTLKHVHQRNVLCFCLQKWKLHYISRNLLLKALVHYRMSLLYHTWHLWVKFVKQKQQKTSWKITARIYRRKTLQSRTFMELMRAYRNETKAKLHYRLKMVKMFLVFWKKGATISSQQSNQIITAVQKCSVHLTLRRTLDIWIHQLWLVSQSRQADLWFLSRFFRLWHRKHTHLIAWRHQVLVRIEHHQMRSVLLRWHQRVQFQKRRDQSAASHLQTILLKKLFSKWRKVAKRQLTARLHLETQTLNEQGRTKRRILSIWKNRLKEKQKSNQLYFIWSEKCVRKAVLKWKESHLQKALHKRSLLFEPMKNLLKQKDIFRRWKQAWERANFENEAVHRNRAILQQKYLAILFKKWNSKTLAAMAMRPIIQHQHSKLLLRVFRAWRRFLWEKSVRSKNSWLLHYYRKKQLFQKWRNLFALREKEKALRIQHGCRLLARCMLGWHIVIERKIAAQRFHQDLLLQKFFTWKKKTVDSLRCKALEEAEQRRCRAVKRDFFSRWRQNTVEQKMLTIESIQQIERVLKRNALAQALANWKHLQKINVLARNHFNQCLVNRMKQIISEWHGYTQSVSCFSVRCLQRKLFIKSFMECPHISAHHHQFQDVGNKDTGSSRELSLLTDQRTITDEDILEESGPRNQKMMTSIILRLKYWPVSLAFLQWRHFTQRSRRLKNAAKQLHTKHIWVILSSTFSTWKQQQQATKRARHHQEKKLKGQFFKKLQNYSICRRFKNALCKEATNHHRLSVFHACFPIWRKKVKEKQHWNRLAKVFNHTSPEELHLQPIELQLTSVLGQRSLLKYFQIWQGNYQTASFYRKRYHQTLQIRYLHIWRSWALYRQDLYQKCCTFRKKRIRSMTLQKWMNRVHQVKWTKKKQQERINKILKIILHKWNQWSSRCCLRNAVEVKVHESHVSRILSESFSSMTREYHKIIKARQWYNDQLIRKVILAWSHRSRFQIRERVKVKEFRLKMNTGMTKRTLRIWKNAYEFRIEKKRDKLERIRRKVFSIAIHWKKKTLKSRGNILQTVFTDRRVRSCFSEWKNRFAALKQLEEKLQIFKLRKEQQRQKNCFAHWKSKLVIARAEHSFRSRLMLRAFKAWYTSTKASVLYQKRFQEYQKVLQKRQMQSAFQQWKIGWKHKQISSNFFKRQTQSRAFMAWSYYVQGRIHLRVQQTCLINQVSTRHLQSAYDKWKRKATARLSERKKEKQQVFIADQHYKNHLSQNYFNVWFQETQISKSISRHRMRLADKYYHRWKYYTDLSYTATVWSERQSYHRTWCKWRASLVREKTATLMEAEFLKQDIRQIFRLWFQYCRHKRIQKKGTNFPVICSNLANI